MKSKINKKEYKMLGKEDLLSKAWQMTAASLDTLTKYYQSKHDIKIYKNGETPFGQEKIKTARKEIEAGYKEQLDQLHDNDTKYAHYVETVNLFKPGPLSAFNLGEKNHELLVSLCTPFLKEGSKKKLSETEIKIINKKIKESEAQKLLEPLLNKQYTKIMTQLKTELEEACLSEEDAWEEIRHIQATLEPGAYVGYVFTGGKNSGPNHFEVLILTNDATLKPISWLNVTSSLHPSSETAYVNLKSALLAYNGGAAKVNYPHPQADRVSCGTLGLMYAKELLKNDAEQLKEYTLSVPYYDEKKNLKYFFFPSPQTLCYSQSSTYNILIQAMLSDKIEPEEIIYQSNKYQIATLKGYLTKSIEIARLKGTTRVIEHNLDILAKLPDFREKWLQAYTKSVEKRAFMDVGSVNQYLSYSSRRMEHYARFHTIRTELTPPEKKGTTGKLDLSNGKTC